MFSAAYVRETPWKGSISTLYGTVFWECERMDLAMEPLYIYVPKAINDEELVKVVGKIIELFRSDVLPELPNGFPGFDVVDYRVRRND